MFLKSIYTWSRWRFLPSFPNFFLFPILFFLSCCNCFTYVCSVTPAKKFLKYQVMSQSNLQKKLYFMCRYRSWLRSRLGTLSYGSEESDSEWKSDGSRTMMKGWPFYVHYIYQCYRGLLLGSPLSPLLLYSVNNLFFVFVKGCDNCFFRINLPNMCFDSFYDTSVVRSAQHRGLSVMNLECRYLIKKNFNGTEALKKIKFSVVKINFSKGSLVALWRCPCMIFLRLVCTVLVWIGEGL